VKLDDEARFFLGLLEQATQAGQPLLHTNDVKVGRPAVDKMSEDFESDPPEVASTQDGALPGIAGPLSYRRYRPLGVTADALATLVYFHGGGFVIGNLETHDSTCRRLANKSRCQIISVAYRLAPEHPYPAALDDALAAFRHVRDNAAALGVDPGRIAVGGDSAGASLALVVCQLCAVAGEPGPAFQMLIYPATDASKDSASRAAFANGYFLSKDLLDWFKAAYIPATADVLDPRLSPLLRPDLTGLPPAFVLTAGYDPLRDEGRAYAMRLVDAGVKTTYTNYPGSIHGFFSLTRVLTRGLDANDEAAAVMAAHFHT
jgi:acetyl esterase